MEDTPRVLVAGAGLAGCEAAWALAEEGIPTWAAQSAANLATCGVLSLDGGLSAPLTRGEAAELLCGALELQDSRDGGWF